MKWNDLGTTIFLFLLGVLIAALKLVYLFFNILNILDILIFLSAGYVVGGKVSGGRSLWGIILALPCMFLDSYFIYKSGFSNIMSGVGTGYLLSLVLVPLSACLGIFIRGRKETT